MVVEMQDAQARRSPRVWAEHAQAAIVAWLDSWEQDCECARRRQEVGHHKQGKEGPLTSKSPRLTSQVELQRGVSIWKTSLRKVELDGDDVEMSARLCKDRTECAM